MGGDYVDAPGGGGGIGIGIGIIRWSLRQPGHGVGREGAGRVDGAGWGGVGWVTCLLACLRDFWRICRGGGILVLPVTV